MASLPYKPDFKVMPEGWDGTVKDLDEVHYEISKKEDEMLYQEFVQRMNFNKMKVTFNSLPVLTYPLKAGEKQCEFFTTGTASLR